MMVEKGGPRLKRARHGRDVHLREEIPGKISIDINVHDLAGKRARPRCRESAVKQQPTVNGSKVPAQLVCVYLSFLLLRETRHEAGIAMRSRLAESFQC